MICGKLFASALFVALGALAAGASAASVADEAVASEGFAREAGVWVEQARQQVSENRFAKALENIDSALALVPDHHGARLLQAKIHSWQGRFAEAEKSLAALRTERPDDSEVRLTQAYLAYYQGRLSESAAVFEDLLRENPADEDARAGLAAVRRAADAPPPKRWRADAGLEYSTFTRRPQDDWHQQFVQLSHTLPDRATNVHARVDAYQQFEMSDVAVEAGVSRAFTPDITGSFAAGWTIAPDFRPDWRVAAEAGWRAWSRLAEKPWALWLLAGARYDVYKASEVAGLNPGVSLSRGDWGVAARVNRTTTIGDASLYGWSTRVDGPLAAKGPYGSVWRFWTGFADAPETVVAGGTISTVSNRTIFAGLGAELRRDWRLNVGYTRDDRENSWIRHNLNASVARLF